MCKLESPKNDEMAALTVSMKNQSDIKYVTAIGKNVENEHDMVSSTLDIEMISKSRIHLWHHNMQQPPTIGINKCTFEPNISDSVVSLRNCSSILHTSSTNHTIYKTNTPSDSSKNLVRQTSTPMHQNVMIIKSPDSITCSCSVSSTSCQVSSIHSSNSSESDISPSTQAKEMK